MIGARRRVGTLDGDKMIPLGQLVNDKLGHVPFAYAVDDERLSKVHCECVPSVWRRIPSVSRIARSTRCVVWSFPHVRM
jgi:hypothetical protein